MSGLKRNGLIRLDVGGADHLAPLLGIFGNEPAEVSRRTDERGIAETFDFRFQCRIGQAGVDFLVEPVDDFG